MSRRAEERLLDEARRHASQMGISPEEFLRNCLDMSHRILQEAPAMMEDFARIEDEIEEAHRELKEKNRRGVRRTYGNSKIFL